MDRLLRFQRELVEACQKVSDHGDPNLSEHGVGSRPEEPLDLQVLLDALEEQLDLPSSLVDVRDRSGSELEVVRQEDIRFACLGIDVSDAPEPAGIFSAGIEAGKSDFVIGGNAGGCSDTSTFQNSVFRICLEPCDKAYRSG